MQLARTSPSQSSGTKAAQRHARLFGPETILHCISFRSSRLSASPRSVKNPAQLVLEHEDNCGSRPALRARIEADYALRKLGDAWTTFKLLRRGPAASGCACRRCAPSSPLSCDPNTAGQMHCNRRRLPSNNNFGGTLHPRAGDSPKILVDVCAQWRRFRVPSFAPAVGVTQNRKASHERRIEKSRKPTSCDPTSTS
jgi:hypothetical protein